MPVMDTSTGQLALLGGSPVATKGTFPKDRPEPSPEDHLALERVIALGGWSMFTSAEVEAFEGEFADRAGARHAVLVNSCTTALYATLLAMDLPPRPRVAVPAYTYVGTATPIKAIGGEAIFVDVEESTLSIDAEALDRALREHSPVHAVVMAHLFGIRGNAREIAAVCAAHGAALVHDCAQLLGDVSATAELAESGPCCFSFGESKMLRIGEGGAIATNSTELLERVRMARHQGEIWLALGRSRVAGTRPSVQDALTGLGSVQTGLNFRPPAFAAALGRTRLRNLQAELVARQDRAAVLLDELRGRAYLQPLSWTPNVWWTLPVLVQDDAVSRETLVAAFLAEGIPIGVHFPLLVPDHPLFGNTGPAEFMYPNARRFATRHLVLPIYPRLTPDHMRMMVRAITKIGAGLEQMKHDGVAQIAKQYLAKAELEELCQGIFYFTA